MALKSQDLCDANDPEEHFLWALTSVPGVGNSPLMIPIQMAKQISQHLYEAGFRHVPAKQEKKWLRPYRGDQSHLNPGGKWVPMDTEEPEPVRIPDINQLTVHEREALLAQYRAQGLIPEPEPAPNVAYVLED